jgi:hypothetical protein
VGVDEPLAACLKVIEVEAYSPGCSMDLVIDDELGQVVAFLV